MESFCLLLIKVCVKPIPRIFLRNKRHSGPLAKYEKPKCWWNWCIIIEMYWDILEQLHL